MAVRLIDSLATTEAMQSTFSDESVLRAMLDFEVALARVEARLGIIPNGADDAIAKAADVRGFDMEALAQATLRAGTPGIPLVKALTERTRAISTDAAGFVHWGATSQDVADTALVLLLKQARPILESDFTKIDQALERLSQEHASTIMLGRTLMQAAPPLTFGFKAAGWLAALRRSRTHLETAFAKAFVLQFGGAVGTLAALGDEGIRVASALADELQISCPDAPWHTHRDRFATLMCALGVLTGTLGKIARDVSLLRQSEIAEVSETSTGGRGGSSTMPHKRNPIGCTVALAAANRMPGLVANFLSGMIQENERSVGGWQAEWYNVSSAVEATALAAASISEVAQSLTVNAPRMKENIVATRGTIFAERAMILLGRSMGRDVAHRLLEEATRNSSEQGKHLSDVLAEMPEVADHLHSSDLRNLEDPEHYLGMAEIFRQRLLNHERPTAKTERN